jgi:hypothetical protein
LAPNSLCSLGRTWAHIMTRILSEELVSGRRHALGRPQRFTSARGFEFKAYSCELVRLEPGDHRATNRAVEPPALHPCGTRDIIINGSTSPIRSVTACQVRAGEKHSPRDLGDIAFSFCLSTIRHASERRIKTLAALRGGNPAPQKPHRADHGLPRQGARRRRHSARPATCSAMRAQGN